MGGLLLSLANRPAPPSAGGLPLGLPPGATGQQQAYAERLWHTRNELLGPHPLDGTGDTEDFWEMAARLSAAVHSEAEEVWLQTPQGACCLKGGSSSKLSLIERLDAHADTPEHLQHYGPIPEGSLLWLRPETRAADAYATWPIFREWAGRPTALVGINVAHSPEGEACEVMASWVREGVVEEGEELVVKATRAKHGLWLVPASASVEANREALMRVLGWAAIHVEEQAGSLLLQPWLELTYEYRVFIVGGRPVAGAGCVEEFTPLYNCGEEFDSRARSYRGVSMSRGEDGLAVSPSPAAKPAVATVEALAKAYRRTAEALVRGLPLATVVVDLAYAPKLDRVVMVEANGLSNSGLYASSPELVVQALLEQQ